MYQGAAPKSNSSSHRVLYACGGALILAPRFAQASLADDVITSATVSPAVAFGLGCAVGAVFGGLVAGLLGRRSRRALRSELDEVVAAAERANLAAQRAEKLLAAREQPVQDSAAVEAKTATNESEPASRAARGVRSVLRERLGAGAFADLPVIDRGAQRQPAKGDFVNPQVTRNLGRRTRSAEIDRRVPRFDESLFPDLVSEATGEVDSFEAAMRAMEEEMGSHSDQQPTPALEFVAPSGHPEITDASSYVDFLVQDEMERNRSGSARRYSRAHLTMIEGTGDLSAVRKARRYQPRHLPKTSKEA